MATPAAALVAHRPDAARKLWFGLAIGALIAVSWIALWYWNASPYRRYVEHAGLLEPGALLALCLAIPPGEIVVPLLLYAFGCVLMIAAMMLPTTYQMTVKLLNVMRGRPVENQLSLLVC